MKKIFYVAATAAMLASCSTDFDLSEVFGSGGTSETIGFQVQKGNNVTRATSLQNAGHYNFGVFGYKESDKTYAVMSDYLVGYYNKDLGYYDKAGSTWGDEPGVKDSISYWMYEGMGKDDFYGTYAGKTLERFYQSNNSKQYLKYWDKTAKYTCFYAYAPYFGTDTQNERVTYVDGADVEQSGDTYVLNFPNGTIKAGYDDLTKYEYMYAAKKVPAADYGHDVSLDFKRLVAKVNIKFWEDIPGYKVRIIDLKQGKYKGVQATPSIKKSNETDTENYGPYGYRYGTYYKSNGVKIHFDHNNDFTATIRQYDGDRVQNAEDKKENLIFAVPVVSQIGEARAFASASATDYYAIPKGSNEKVLADNTTKFAEASTEPNSDLAKTGFTFHVSYELTAEDTNERIVVQNATVHVPYNYCNWEANTHYTYIFKITKNSNGSTDTEPDVNPNDPDVPTVQTLYPIVFDNCTIQDWTENESDWNITENNPTNYHNISLTTGTGENATTCYSIKYGEATDLTVKINDNDGHSGHAIVYTKVSSTTTESGETLKSGVEVTGPSGTDYTTSWYTGDTGSGKISVPNDAPQGVYTVTYYCPYQGDHKDINNTHPKTWSVNFTVGSVYTIKTHHDYVGTKFNEESVALDITGTKDGGAYTLPVNGLSIEYPTTLPTEQQEYVKVNDTGTQVSVTKNAAPGEYKVVYKTKVNGIDVKVAEHVFYVKDYNFTFSPTTVYNKVGGTKITCSQWNPGEIFVTSESGTIQKQGYTTTLSGATFTNNAVTIPNNTAEGSYNITYTIWNGDSDAAKATYTKTFTVENTYLVTIDKSSLDRDLNSGASNTYSEDYLTVTTLKNGVADKGRTNALKVFDSNNTDKTTNFKIECVKETQGESQVDTNTYKLYADKNVTAGTYTLEFTGQTPADGASAPVTRKSTVTFKVITRK